MHKNFFDDESEATFNIRQKKIPSSALELIRQFFDRIEIKVAVGAIFAALALGYFAGDIFGSNDLKAISSQASSNSVLETKTETLKVATSLVTKIKVYITGEITNPGVYEIENNSRLTDLIALAGNTTQNADLKQCNLASFLSDGMKIIVPTNGQASTSCGSQSAVEAIASPGTSAAANSTTGALVNLNTATEAQLEELPGVGPSYASSIIDYREKNGGFKSVIDLKNVKGIGEKRFEDLKDLVTV